MIALRNRWATVALALLLAPGWTPAAAQLIDLETWSQLVVDHPLERKGDVDGLLRSWLDLVEEEPDHPLVQGTLHLVSQRFDELAHPAGLAERILSLDGEEMVPAARRELDVLVARMRRLFAPAESLAGDLHPEHLSAYRVLGPLGPLGDPMGAAADSPLWTRPGFGEVHDGAYGPVSWVPGDRTATRRFVRPQGVAYPGSGYVMTAARFDVTRGGPAWIEVEAVGSVPRRGNASWAWSLNGSAPQLVDRLGTERGRLIHLPVSLRTGRNRLLLRSTMDVQLDLAVRVLGPDGRPYAGLVEATSDADLGAAVDAPPPAGPVPVEVAGSEAALAALSEREPHSEAFLGWLVFLDQRQAEGLGHLRAALAAAPGSTGLASLMARCVEDAGYLPDVWRRNRARELAEEVLARDAQRLDMGLAMAEVLRGEDREEEALALLDQLTEVHGQQADSLLARRRAHRDLGMEAQAEADLDEALRRAPHHPGALQLLASHEQDVGQVSSALDAGRRRLRSAGASAQRLVQLAKEHAQVGRVEEAEALFREAELRRGLRGYAPDLADFLSEVGRYGEADALLARIEELYPRWSKQRLARADVALRAGDREAELRHLRAALELTPGWRPVRQRVEALTGEHRTRRLQERYGVDREAALAVYDDDAYDDSVVRILDSAVVSVFPDGTAETLTHNLIQVRDLDGCESQGTQRLSGDVLGVVTIKAADGAVYEPVKVGNEYVMPSLEPGDLIETITRSISNRPPDRVVRPGSWMFASEAEPFVLSRYVIAHPKDLPLRLVQRNYDGTHEVHEEGDLLVHVFETHGRGRVLPEPATPPREWYLPWVELGVDRELQASLAWLTVETIPARRVTPEIAERCEEILAGIEGQENQARALFAFVSEHLDQRWEWSQTSATEALLMREGNPTYLYAALLSAAGIAHDVAWSRNESPDGDPMPEPAFLDGSWWRRKLLVRVRPDDGRAAWCDLGSRTMPYGSLLDDEPGAPAYLVDTGERIELPQLPLERRGPGMHLTMELELDEQLDASVQASLSVVGGMGYTAKEPIQEVPDTVLKMVVGASASQVIPRIDVMDFELTGLDDDQPLSAQVSGRVTAFLDDDGSQLSCRLPFPALELGSQFAGEGVRRLPFFLPTSVVHSAQARIRLPAGLQLVDPPRGLSESFAGGRYALSVEQDGEDVWTVRREVLVPPFVLAPEEFETFRQLCARIDEAERARLRFARR